MARAPAPSRGVPVWAFALLGVVALAAVVGLGVVLTRDASSGEGADEDDRSSANASGKAKKKKKSNSKKKKNAPSTEKASPEAPKIDISALEITSAYPRFLAAAKKQRKDPQLVLITLPSVSPDSGMVMPDRAAVMRFRSGEPPVCIDVVASKGQLITSEDGCIKQVNTPIRAPRCSLPHVVKKALASVPRKPLQITYMAGADGPVWAVADSGGDGVARVPDDC